MRFTRGTRARRRLGLLMGCAIPLIALVSVIGCDDDDDDVRLTCTPLSGPILDDLEARLYFEFQSTDDDTGIHGAVGGVEWKRLCITAPNGAPFLLVQPGGDLRLLGVTEIAFESNEPAGSQTPQSELLGRFPAGTWSIGGITTGGLHFEGRALLSHDIPSPPLIIRPVEGEVVDPLALQVSWHRVSNSLQGKLIEITGYEVVVTNEDKEGEDPNGLSQPILSAHLPPSATSFKVPAEFLEPGTLYELEVIAIENSGNQTITVRFFETP